MCGFIACRKNGIGNNNSIQLRGQDHTSIKEINGFVFVHNLLHVTGVFFPQPFFDNDIVCVYNGEIYGLPFEKSDGELLIPLYKKYGELFPQYIDGEFAIALYDFGNKTAIFASDPFRTKPIFINGDGAASYASGLKVKSSPLKPNSILVRNLYNNREKMLTTKNFDFNNQHKKNYDDWIKAFDMAVLKRCNGKKVFIGLSSGYDSGALLCSLKNQKLSHMTFSIKGIENAEIIKSRGGSLLNFTMKDYEQCKEFVLKNVESFNSIHHGDIRYDGASYGLAYIIKEAKKFGLKIYLSGQGGDEILSDYSKWPGHSDFNGKFPDKLTPWKNFYGHCQEAFLAKEEYVAGAFNIEARYPFLDSKLVQEFLWLDVELKNKYYKAPLREYFIKNNFPFEENIKHGFDPKAGVK